MVEIVDGSGAGNRAKVEDDNSLLTTAITITEEHNLALENEDAYIVSVGNSANDTLPFLTTEQGYVLILQSLDVNRKLTIEIVGASADVLGGVIKFVRNPTLGTLGANTPVTPTNLNFSSTKTAIGNFQVWDGTGGAGITGLTQGEDVVTHILGAGFTGFPIRGSFILDQNDVFAIFFDNVTGSTINFECNIRFYYE